MSLNSILATAPLTTSGYHIKANGTTLGNSLIWDNGTNVGIGNTNTSYTLDVSGTLRNTTSAYFATTSGSVGIGTTSPSSWATNLVVYNNQLTITGGGYDATFADSIFFGGNSEGTTYRNKISNSLSSNPANQKMKFSVASGSTTFADVMTLVGNGNVGIGTSSPSKLFTVVSSTDGQNAGISGTTYGIRFDNGGTFGFGGSTIHGVDNTLTATYQILALSGSQLLFTTVGTERMRITSGGAICINTTAPISAGRFNIVDDCNSTTPIEIKDTAASNSGAYMIRFVNNSGVVCGSIAHQTSTTTQYNTSSDYRLKTDLKDYNGLDIVSKIKTYDFEWIEDNNRMYGVLAHELAEIIPYAVNGEKDGEQMQGADYSKIVPVLVKAIQEQQAQIDELKNKLNNV